VYLSKISLMGSSGHLIYAAIFFSKRPPDNIREISRMGKITIRTKNILIPRITPGKKRIVHGFDRCPLCNFLWGFGGTSRTGSSKYLMSIRIGCLIYGDNPGPAEALSWNVCDYNLQNNKTSAH
jgi:hypothetical protein